MPESLAGFFADDNTVSMPALYHRRQMTHTYPRILRGRTADKSA